VKKISGSTFWYKKAFPTIWFGFLGFFVFIMIFPTVSGKAQAGFLIVPIAMAIFGYFMFRNLIWDLSDEVFDAGNELIFRKGGKEQHVKLSDISNISYSYMTSPERVVVSSRVNGPIGRELVFCPPMRFLHFKRSPLIAELIERVDRARNK